MEFRRERKSKRKVFIILLVLILLGGGFLAYKFSDSANSPLPKPVATTTPVVIKPKPKPKPPEFGIVSYPEDVKQGDPVIIVAYGVASTTSVASFTFNNRPLNFFLYEGNVTAFFGADLNWDLGTFPIVLTLKDGRELRANLVIKARVEVREPYNIPEKLGGNTKESINTLIKTLAQEGKIINALPSAREVMWTDNFRSPFDTPLVLDDEFGYTRVIGSLSMPHKGTDFVAPIGTNVYAMNKGIVRLATEMRNYGKTVIIDHGAGIQTVYMHLSEIKVLEGANVERGQLIALTGDTGYADHPHLHLTVKIWDIAIDPVKFLDLFSKEIDS